ncbi:MULTISPECIES: acyl-CoA dehydrogenase family protein [Actinomycetes]|uniref:acyl-CoA dehydrogenase family protein n=1 Tax=Actinomycetes TaxID=1760 RepID=UPI0002E35BF7|nr:MULTISPECIES: acyl-CoA dehydrogenase family protein [Actinomycetes]
MTAAHTVVPTAEELVARVRDLAALLKSNGAEGEKNRRVAEESIKALIDAGLFRIATPKRYGGCETSLRTMLDVSAAVAEAAGGTSWVVTLTNAMSWVVGLFPDRARDEVFGTDPDAKVSGVLTPTAEARKVEGGWRATGKRFCNSGSLHTTWAGLPSRSPTRPEPPSTRARH